MARSLKREAASNARRGEEEAAETSQRNGNGDDRQGVTERRVLRSRYLAVKNQIIDGREDISNAESDKFSSIISEVESLHQLVQNPREQVADAEALLDIANTLVTSVKSQSNDGISPADFVTALLSNFGGTYDDNAHSTVSWENVGLAVSHIFRKAPGCCTMVGPMSIEMKQRKAVVHRKRTKPSEKTRPEELDSAEPEGKTDTDKNMSAMFNVLRKNRSARLENLVLNRVSFAQTVENIFALSFLVKDGRAEITINDSGNHLVSPRNAPAAAAVASKDVSFNHFVFRFDFKDWKLMADTVQPGEELMPHRTSSDTYGSGSQGERVHSESQPAAAQPTTPIRKLTRNRGLIIQEHSVVDEDLVVEDSIEKHPPLEKRPPSSRKGKRRLYDAD